MAAAPQRRWSAKVMRTSNALDLEPGVFTRRSPRAIAQSLKRSAEHSKRRKSAPFRSAMSMLVFHLNRGGKGLPHAQREVLERAKVELRKLYGREPPKSAGNKRSGDKQAGNTSAGNKSAGNRGAGKKRGRKARSATKHSSKRRSSGKESTRPHASSR
jgi:hypothetical protein